MHQRFYAIATVAGMLVLGCKAQDAAPPPTPAAQPPPQQQRTIDQLSAAELVAVAQSMRNAGQIAEAQQIIAKALAKDERNVEAQVLAGELCLAQTPTPDTVAAQKHFMLARMLSENDFRANVGLGRLYMSSRIWRNARFHFMTAEKVAPPDQLTEILVLLAEAHRNSGDMASALEAAKRAVDNDGKSIDARQMLVALLVDQGVLDRAMTENDGTLQIAKELVTTAANKLDAIRNLYRTYETRVAILRELGNRNYRKLPDGRTSDNLLPGREAEMTANLKQLSDVFVLMAEMRLLLSYYDTISYLETACRYSPQDPDAWMRLGRLYRNTSQFDLAAKAFQKVVDLDSSNSEARRELDALGVIPAPPEPASKPAIEVP